MKDLLTESMNAAPPMGRCSWVRYKPVWENLRANGYSPRQAASWIAEREGLSVLNMNKLNEVIKKWKM